MKNQLQSITWKSLTVALVASSCFAGDYRVRHNYALNLDTNQTVRAKWNYQQRARAYSKSGGYVKARSINRTKDLTPGLHRAPALTATSGGATAVAHASVSYGPTAGWHQVDGEDTEFRDGIYARAFSASNLAWNVGKVKRNGRIKWAPRWSIDTVKKGRRIERDPVIVTARDPITGQEVTDTLFDLHVDLGNGGSGRWEEDRFTLNGRDGMFALVMDSPLLTSGRGKMMLQFDKAGRVTHSEATGIFTGALPNVDQPAIVDFKISDYVGDASGIDLDFDFGMPGELDFEAKMSGDGLTQGYRRFNDAAVHDFSYVDVLDYRRLLGGTPLVASHQRPIIDMVIPEPDSDPYAGFLRLGDDPHSAIESVAFDSIESHDTSRIRGDFDFRLGARNGQPSELSFLLLPTDMYEPSGDIGPLLSPQFSSQNPNLPGALGIGIQVLGDDRNPIGQMSLSWDGHTIDSQIVPLAELGLQPQSDDWSRAEIQIDPQDHGSRVSLVFQGAEEPVVAFDQFVDGVFLPESIRPAFVSNTPAPRSFHDLDNVFVFFDSPHALGDFNGDARIDVDDVTQLVDAIVNQTFDPIMDLNTDNQLDGADLVSWVKDIAGSYFGDSNVDGRFDEDDLITAFAAGMYETGDYAIWAAGDWNADGVFSADDLIAAFEDGGYNATTAAAVGSIPEPSSFGLFVVAFCVVAGRCRRRSSYKA